VREARSPAFLQEAGRRRVRSSERLLLERLAEGKGKERVVGVCRGLKADEGQRLVGRGCSLALARSPADGLPGRVGLGCWLGLQTEGGFREAIG